MGNPKTSFKINILLVHSPSSLNALPLLFADSFSFFTLALWQRPLGCWRVLSFLVATHPPTHWAIFLAHSYNSLDLSIATQVGVVYYSAEISFKTGSALLYEFWVAVGFDPKVRDWERRQLKLHKGSLTFNLASISCIFLSSLYLNWLMYVSLWMRSRKLN